MKPVDKIPKKKEAGLYLTLAEKFNNQHAPGFTGDVGGYVLDEDIWLL